MSTVESVRIGMLRKALRSSGGGRLPEPEDCREGKSEVRSGAPPAEAQPLRSTALNATAPSRDPALVPLRIVTVVLILPARAFLLSVACVQVFSGCDAIIPPGKIRRKFARRFAARKAALICRTGGARLRCPVSQ